MKAIIEVFTICLVISIAFASIFFLASHTPDFKKGLEQHLTRPIR